MKPLAGKKIHFSLASIANIYINIFMGANRFDNVHNHRYETVGWKKYFWFSQNSQIYIFSQWFIDWLNH
jgi:hypothetical protein